MTTIDPKTIDYKELTEKLYPLCHCHEFNERIGEKHYYSMRILAELLTDLVGLPAGRVLFNGKKVHGIPIALENESMRVLKEVAVILYEFDFLPADYK